MKPLINQRIGRGLRLRRGYISVISVLILTSTLFLVLLSAYRNSIQSQDVQAAAQLRIDYAHREQALLRAVLNEFPNQAMNTMMANTDTTGWSIKNRWRWIFEYARVDADGETALSSSVANQLGISSSAVGNVGDGAQDHIINNIMATINQNSLHMFYINAGTNGTAAEEMDRVWVLYDAGV